jgi:mannosyltransferase
VLHKSAVSLHGRLQFALRQRAPSVLAWLLSRRDLLAGAGVAALSAALSLHELGRYSFWRDEVNSVHYSSAPLHELVTIIGRNTQAADVPFMATYNVLLHFWLAFADAEAEIRLLSVFAGVGTTIFVYLIGRRLSGWLAGTVGALAFAAAPYVIHWNQEARSYSLAMLVSATLTHLLLWAIERPTIFRFGLYGVIGAVGLYVHYYVGLVLAVHAGYVVLTRSWPSRGPFLAGAVPLAIAALPLPYLATEYAGSYAWIPRLTLGHIRDTLATLAGGLPVLAATAAVVVGGVVVHRRDRRVWLVLALTLAPIVVAISVSVVRPMFLDRYLVICLPPMAILTGIGFAALRPTVARAAAIGAFAILLALSVPSAYADSHQQDWRAAGAWIAEAGRPGDEAIVTPWGRRQLYYYIERIDGAVLPRPTAIKIAIATPAHERPDQLWLVMTNLSAQEERRAIKRLSVAFEPTEARAFGDKVTVVHLQPID